MYGWYRNFLSDYKQDISEGKWKEKSICRIDVQTGEVLNEKPLYIFNPDNIGEKMSIDDKQIGKGSYTIMTNANTGKIAMLIESVKADEVSEALSLFGDKLQHIKTISCDMSPSYLKVCYTVLPLSEVVIDKFHVIKYVYDAVQDVRLRIRKQLNDELSKGKTKSLKDKAVFSDLELLRRTSRLLNQSKEKWSEDNAALMHQLFCKFPLIQQAYILAQDFKQWYQKENSKLHRITIEKKLFDWYEKAEKSMIKEFKPVVRMIEKHEENIINFFSCNHTNAGAERMNGKIKRFVSNNYGFRDKDFGLYRLAGYFS